MKKWLIPALLLVSLSFASAQTGGLGELLDLVNENTLILMATFIISFSVLFFALNKFFGKKGNDPRYQGNPMVAGSISLAIAILITYAVNKAELTFNIQGWFSNIGVSQEALMTIIPLIVLGAAIFLVIKFGTKALIVLGVLLVVVGLLVFEEASTVVMLGVVIAIVGLIIAAVLKFLGLSAGLGGKKRKIHPGAYGPG